MAFPIAEAQLTALFLQSIAYGIHVVTFAACIYAWLSRSRASSVSGRWLWMAVATALFIVGTIDVSFNFYHNLVAFIFYTGPGGPTGEFESFSSWINVIRSLWFALQALISDASLIYRCWTIYQRRLVVLVIPVLLWVATAVCAGADLYCMFELKRAATIASASTIQPWFHAFFALSLTVNMLTTGLIVSRIWSIHKLSSKMLIKMSGSLSLSHAIRIFVESALLYTSWVAICLITELVNTNWNYAISDITMELAGICFDLIIIRICTGVSMETAVESAGTWQYSTPSGES
ncbi:hypothetical protein FOMPIDRAFT_131222 [Fomitopsis schrenkii]|uniref:Uncharacterized protein n=1 Tax=Fomitopsis schrenkii TaxID=2126942 RepID=S8DR50_FOMSC|nr:hypothetical protein FOMPIDRAFT_131222 [Fomitopsis schrenkii]